MLVTLLAVLLSQAQNEVASDPCAIPQACRLIDKVRIENPDGKEVLLEAGQALPWVTQGNLLPVPGDWIVVRLVQKDGTLLPELVRAGHGSDAPEPAEGEIRFIIHDYESAAIKVEVLSRRNEPLDYAALMVTPSGPQRTSVCTLLPGVRSIEIWQQPIRQFAFWNFRSANGHSCKVMDFPKSK